MNNFYTIQFNYNTWHFIISNIVHYQQQKVNNNFIRMSAYSMGKANKQPSFIAKSQAPGAGAYETKSWTKVSRIKSSPSATMPRTKKFFNENETKPANIGPGSYNPEKPQVKLAASMKGRTKILYTTQSPSPCNYNVDVKFSSKKYSFGRSMRRFKTQQGPGPANYTVNTIHENTGPVFGKQERNKLSNQKIPGPGTYNCKNQGNLKGFQEFSFPKQKKFISQQTEIKEKSKVPGPGAYSITNYKQIYRGGKFTYGQRMNIANKSEAPGPGFYDPKYATEKKNPNPVIGHEKRQFYNSTTTPGPGTYETPKAQLFKKKDGVAVFAHGQRQLKVRTLTPGPGSYDTKPLNQSRAHSIGSRHVTSNTNKAPGPQQYNPDHSKIQKKAGRAIFGSEKKLSHQKSAVPGPGEYKVGAVEQGKTFYFNKAKSTQKLNSTVGPGQYKLKPYIGMYNGARKEDKEILYV